MAFISALSTYVPDGTGTDGHPRHLSRATSEMLSVHEMVELAAHQIDPAVLSVAADSTAASFHCGSLYQGEHFWPIQNSLQQSVLGSPSAGAATEIRQFCSGGLYGVMLADAVLEARWAGDYAMVTGGDSNFFFDRYEYAANPATEGSLMGDSAFCTVLNRHEGFARILSVAARSHNPSADMMRTREDRGLDDPSFPKLMDWVARSEEYDRRHPGSAADNAMASFQTAVSTVTECYLRAGVDPDEIDWFAPSFIEPSQVMDMLAKQAGLRSTPGLHSFASRFGHVTVSDFCVNLVYLMNKKIAKVGDLVMLFATGNFVTSAAVLIRIEKEVTLPFNVGGEL
jgi:3-oxoacyl-[acyl-carrier-protein] synthase III